MLVTSAPGALLPRHTHPGVELSYVVEGELTVTIEGRPDFVVKAGSSFSVSPGVVHSARNTASTPTKAWQAGGVAGALIMRPVLGEQQREMALRTGVRAVISSAGGQPSPRAALRPAFARLTIRWRSSSAIAL